MDIVILALARWDGPYSSTTFSLAKEFSKSNRVFYIENPLTLKYVLRNILSSEVRQRLLPLIFSKDRYKKLNNVKGDLTILTPPVVLPINFLRRGKLYNKLSEVNDARLLKSLMNLLRDFKINDFIYVNVFNPFYLRQFSLRFRPKLNIYITVDDISNSKYISKHGSYLEDEMVSSADFVFCTSRELKRLKERVSKNVYLLPNAADIEIFKGSNDLNLEKPTDISFINKPIIVYTGHIDHRIDYDLMMYLLETLDTYYFIMVGPISAEKELINSLKTHSNILFTGKKELVQLPAYLKYSACAIIPFKCNTLTKSIYPLKINEYLASGKPVVSSSFSEDINEFRDVISIPLDYKDFAIAVKNSIDTDSADQMIKRIKFVENNNWGNRVSMFWSVVSSCIGNNS